MEYSLPEIDEKIGRLTLELNDLVRDITALEAKRIAASQDGDRLEERELSGLLYPLKARRSVIQAEVNDLLRIKKFIIPFREREEKVKLHQARMAEARVKKQQERDARMALHQAQMQEAKARKAERLQAAYQRMVSAEEHKAAGGGKKKKKRLKGIQAKNERPGTPSIAEAKNSSQPQAAAHKRHAQTDSATSKSVHSLDELRALSGQRKKEEREQARRDAEARFAREDAARKAQLQRETNRVGRKSPSGRIKLDTKLKWKEREKSPIELRSVKAVGQEDETPAGLSVKRSLLGPEYNLDP